MFSSEVQFGHAGACANADRETATAKNAALAEAGCRTAKSFDELGTLIEEVSLLLFSSVSRRFVCLASFVLRSKGG